MVFPIIFRPDSGQLQGHEPGKLTLVNLFYKKIKIKKIVNEF